MGGSTNLWGQTLLFSDVNKTTFGVAVGLEAGASTVNFDSVSLTVYYYTNTLTAFAGTVANVGSSGVAWGTPANAAGATNATYAGTAPMSIKGVGASDYLEATNFGFNIPGGSFVNGVSASIVHHATNASTVYDDFVSLIKGGVVQGNNEASPTMWNTSDSAAIYGSGGDTFGLTLAASDVTATNFGICLQAQNVTSTSASGFVDSFAMTLYYVPGAGTTSNVNPVAAMLLGNWS